MPANKNEVITLLTELVKIKSPYFREAKAIKFCKEWFITNNLPCYLHNYEDKKITKFKGINAIGEIKGQKNGPTVLFNGHIDTVELCEGWTKNPYGAEIVDDKLYGVGALDMKSGVAAMMVAIKDFVTTYPKFKGSIKYHIVSDEEGPYGLGTDALINDRLCIADVAIIPEPSAGFVGKNSSTVCLGARGGVSYKVNVRGISAHAATPEKGINAIVEMSKLIVELKKLDTINDDKLGKGSTAIISIEGGGAPASIADFASFSVFRHMVRGETIETIKKEIHKACENANIDNKYIEIEFRKSPTQGTEAFLPYVCDIENEYIAKYIAAINKVDKKYPNIDYFPSIGDFCYIGSRLQIPTIVHGPIGKNYHGADEYVNIQSVIDSYHSIFEFLKSTLL